MKGRVSVVCATVLAAALLAACAGAQAAPGAAAVRNESTPTRTAVAGQGGQPANASAAPVQPAGPAAPATEEKPAGKRASFVLPAEARTSEGGGVTVQATPSEVAGGDLVFTLSLNTHSVDLSYDYRALASLRDDRGNVYPAAHWDGGSGGHHLEGKLIFSGSALQPVQGAKWVELELKGIGGVPARTFRWNLG